MSAPVSRAAGAGGTGRSRLSLHPTVRRPLAVVTALVIGTALWQAISSSSGGWVPSLGEVVSSANAALHQHAFYADALVTLRRVAIILAASTILGFLIGLVAGLSERAESFVRPLLVTGLAIPDPVYIIMGILILGVSRFSGMAAVIVAITPLVANVVLSAVQGRDRGLDEMAFTYGFGWIDYLRQVLVWQITPAIVAAVRTAFA
ncbi:MAG: ABC transporter permease, partial [Nocardioidaceae bacterium]